MSANIDLLIQIQEIIELAVLLFRLRYVPEDEAQDIRDLLKDNEIDYYETSAGILGFSMPGIWLKDDAELSRAKQLVEEYQQQRQEQAQSDYQKQLASGQARTMLEIFKEAPLRFLAYLLTIGIVIYFSIAWLYHLA